MAMRTRTLLVSLLLALPAVAEDVWLPIPPDDPGSRFEALHVAGPEVAFASGEAGTLFRSRDGGASWTPAPRITLQTLFAIHGPDARTIVAAGKAGTLVRTADGGETWQNIRSGTSRSLRSLAFVDAAVGFAGGDSGTLLKTADAGLTWSPLPFPFPNDLYHIQFLDARTGYASDPSLTLFRTEDGGATWKKLPIVLEGRVTPLVPLRQMQFLDAAHGFLIYRYTDPNGPMHPFPPNRFMMLSTEDGGNSWRKLPGIEPVSMRWKTRMDGMVALSLGELRVTSDGGQTWKANPGLASLNQPPKTAFSFWSDQVGAIGCNSGLVAWTRDGGATWRLGGVPLRPEDPLVAPEVHGAHFLDCERGYKVGGRNYSRMPGSAHVTRDGGLTWTELASPDPFDLQAVHFLDTSRGIVAGGGSERVGQYRAALHLTTDGGRSWKSLGEGVETVFRALSFPTARKGFVAGDRGALLATGDGGGSWTALPGIGADVHALQFLDEQVGFAGGLRVLPPAAPSGDFVKQGVLLGTLDGGRTWRTLAIDSQPSPVLSLQFFSQRTGFFLARGGSLKRTDDGGANWASVGEEGRFLAFRFASPDTGFAAGEEIWRTQDGGRSWVQRGHSGFVSPGRAVLALPDAHSGFLAYPSGREFKMLDPVFAPVSLRRAAEPRPSTVPLLELLPGRLAFALVGSSRVTATIIDAKGRFRTRLADGTLGAGRHSLAVPASPCGNSPCFLDFRAGTFRRALPLGRASR